MKRSVLFLAFFLSVFMMGTAMAQVQTGAAPSTFPETMNYQALVRHANNRVASNEQVKLRLSVLDGQTVLYTEEATVYTNQQGVFSYAFGGNHTDAKSLRDLDWGKGGLTLLSEIKFDGESDYSLKSTQPLQTVPYAFHANTAASLLGFTDTIAQLRTELSNVKGELLNAISAVQNDLNDEVNRANGAEAALGTRIANDSLRLEAEVVRAKGVEADNAKGIVDSTAKVRAELANEVSRANGAETALGTRIDTTSTGIRADLNAETLRANNAEQALGVRIDTTSTGIRTDLNAEVVRANNAEQALGVRIDTTSAQIRTDLNAEVVRANNAEAALGVRIDTTSAQIRTDLNAEVVRANNAEAALGVRIDTTSAQIRSSLNDEITRASNAEYALGIRIDTTSTGIRTDLNTEILRANAVEYALGIRIDTTSNQIRTDLNTEISRANNAEAALGVRIDTTSAQIRSSLNDEISRANNAEAALGVRIDTTSAQIRSSLNNEIIRAEAAEEVLTNNLNKEIQRADSVENAIKVDLNNEVSRATNAEAQLDAKINRETLRADSVENVIKNDLNNEVTRATNAEAVLTNNLNNEISRANDAENSLSVRINDDSLRLVAENIRAVNAENTLTTALNNENTRAIAAENALSARIIADSLRLEQDTAAIFARIRTEREESILGDSAIYHVVMPQLNYVIATTNQVVLAEAEQNRDIAKLKDNYDSIVVANDAMHTTLSNGVKANKTAIANETARATRVEDSLAAVVTNNAIEAKQLVDSLADTVSNRINNLTDELHTDYYLKSQVRNLAKGYARDTANVVRAEFAAALADVNSRIDATNDSILDVMSVTRTVDSTLEARIDSIATQDAAHYADFTTFKNGQYKSFKNNIRKELADTTQALRDTLAQVVASIYDSVAKLDEAYDTITVSNEARITAVEQGLEALKAESKTTNDIAVVLHNGNDADGVAIKNLGVPTDNNDAARINEVKFLRDTLVGIITPMQQKIDSLNEVIQTLRDEMSSLNIYIDTNVYFAAGKYAVVRGNKITLVDTVLYDTIAKNAAAHTLYTILRIHTFDAATILDGTGLSETSPFIIDDAADYVTFTELAQSAYVGSNSVYAQLANDIVLTSAVKPVKNFKGIFDGNDKTITLNGLDVEGDTTGIFGLFAKVSNATIKSLTLAGTATVNYDGTKNVYAGAFAGEANTKTVIDNCYNQVNYTVIAPNSTTVYAGAIVGLLKTKSTVKNSIFDATTTLTVNAAASTAYVGGVTGQVYNSFVSNNAIRGSYDVTANKAYVAVLAGRAAKNTTEIRNNYATFDAMNVTASSKTITALATSCTDAPVVKNNFIDKNIAIGTIYQGVSDGTASANFYVAKVSSDYKFSATLTGTEYSYVNSGNLTNSTGLNSPAAVLNDVATSYGSSNGWNATWVDGTLYPTLNTK